MKKFFQCTAALLCCALIAGILPARAVEGGAFLSVTVETIDSDGNVQTAGDVCYTDGQDLYVTPDFLCRYTLYYYDDASAAFVRAGQEPGSKYGCVILNAAEKSVLMYPNPECPFSYTLRDVFEFGGEYFLPLDQMAGYLKARVLVEGTTVTIANSGYSMADAEYAFSKIETDKAYTGYDYTSIVDDLYGGSEAAFYFSTVKNYFSSTIFGLRLSNLDILFQSGKREDYESFLESCVTDNSTYLEAAGADNLQQRFADAQGLNREINTYANKFNEITTLVNKAAEPAKDSGLDTALLYLDTRDWGAVLSTVADCTGYLDYLLALGAMSEDHRNMLRAFDPAGTGEKNAPLEHAVQNLKDRYTNDVTLNLVNAAGQVLTDHLKQQAGDAILEAVIPSTAVISGVATAFKLLGYDLTDNQEYSILIDFSAKYALRRAYWALPHNYDSSEQTEAYRLGVIFFLLACRETFRAANQIAVTTDVPGDYYDPQIETIESVLNLFYAAARSREFDSRTGWQEIIRQNESAIAESGIASAAPTLTEEEALATLQDMNTNVPPSATPSNPSPEPSNTALEEEAAAMARFILNDYKEYMNWNTGNEILVMDLTNDKSPELIFISVSPSSYGSFIDNIISFYNLVGYPIKNDLLPMMATYYPAINPDGQLCFTKHEIPSPDYPKSVWEDFYSTFGSTVEYTFGPKTADDLTGVDIPIYTKTIPLNDPEQVEEMYTYLPDAGLKLYTQDYGPDGTRRNKPLAEENDTYEELYHLILEYMTTEQGE